MCLLPLGQTAGQQKPSPPSIWTRGGKGDSSRIVACHLQARQRERGLRLMGEGETCARDTPHKKAPLWCLGAWSPQRDQIDATSPLKTAACLLCSRGIKSSVPLPPPCPRSSTPSPQGLCTCFSPLSAGCWRQWLLHERIGSATIRFASVRSRVETVLQRFGSRPPSQLSLSLSFATVHSLNDAASGLRRSCLELVPGQAACFNIAFGDIGNPFWVSSAALWCVVLHEQRVVAAGCRAQGNPPVLQSCAHAGFDPPFLAG